MVEIARRVQELVNWSFVCRTDRSGAEATAPSRGEVVWPADLRCCSIAKVFHPAIKFFGQSNTILSEWDRPGSRLN